MTTDCIVRDPYFAGPGYQPGYMPPVPFNRAYDPYYGQPIMPMPSVYGPNMAYGFSTPVTFREQFQSNRYNRLEQFNYAAKAGAGSMFAGALLGAGLGAAFIPPFGAIIGAAIGGAVGYFGGRAVGQQVGKYEALENDAYDNHKMDGSPFFGNPYQFGGGYY